MLFRRRFTHCAMAIAIYINLQLRMLAKSFQGIYSYVPRHTVLKLAMYFDA